ncbi:MAG: hypothetical protein D6751_01370 [Deltaproteobacteria bacterium]|nr:MAG: hypothetical protein D6751_01370 [Deltaproteobacteria bacterium]
MRRGSVVSESIAGTFVGSGALIPAGSGCLPAASIRASALMRTRSGPAGAGIWAGVADGAGVTGSVGAGEGFWPEI